MLLLDSTINGVGDFCNDLNKLITSLMQMFRNYYLRISRSYPWKTGFILLTLLLIIPQPDNINNSIWYSLIGIIYIVLMVFRDYLAHTIEDWKYSYLY